MQITIKRDGGVVYTPGLAKPVTIDVDQLPEDQALQIHELIAAARFFERPQQPQEPGGDRRGYIIKIADGKLSRLLTVADPIEDEALHTLVRRLEALGRAAW